MAFNPSTSKSKQDDRKHDLDSGDDSQDSDSSFGDTDFQKREDEEDLIRGMSSRINKSKKSNHRDRPDAKISNARIFAAIKSLEAQIAQMKDKMGQLIDEIQEIKQSNPTFLSAGRTGSLVRTTRDGSTKVIQHPPM